jgi:hypothetical protein
MSITQQFPVHTGTFITQNGEKRTMNFIKTTDLPSSITSKFTRTRNLREGYETVYDIDKNAFRTFNSNTMVGGVYVSQRSVTIQS